MTFEWNKKTAIICAILLIAAIVSFFWIAGIASSEDSFTGTYNSLEEKRSNVTYLVQAATLDGAVKNINEVMGGTMIDYEKSNIAETKIMDVFEYKKQEDSEA